MQQAGDRTPLLLVVLGSPPPVAVEKIAGRVELEEAVIQRLEHVMTAPESSWRSEDLVRRIPDTLAWTTWAEIQAVVMANRHRFSNAPDGLAATVTRLCDAATTAIHWHS